MLRFHSAMDGASIEHCFREAIDIATLKSILNPGIGVEFNFESTCLILFGPIGVGKTRFGHALASINGQYLYIQCSIFMTRCYDSVKTMQRVFEFALEKNVATIFFDDAQLLGEASTSETLVDTLLQQVNDWRISCPKVSVILTSYLPWNLCKTILLAFPSWMYFGLPSITKRARIFEETLTKHNHAIEDYMKLAEISEGFSAHEIVSAVKDAAWKPIRRLANESGLEPVKFDQMEPLPISSLDVEESVFFASE